MLEVLTSAAMLIHVASFLYVIAFIIRDQLILRILVMAATGLYIAYYYFVPSEPLWAAIVWSVILGAANLWVMVGLILERSTFNMSEQEKELFGAFQNLSPGEFRKLLKITDWHSAQTPSLIISEGKPLDRLFLLISGQADLKKQHRSFSLAGPVFLGEVAFFQKTTASATVTVLEGGQFVSWQAGVLSKLQIKYPGIRVAMIERLNTDMANKIAAS